MGKIEISSQNRQPKHKNQPNEQNQHVARWQAWSLKKGKWAILVCMVALFGVFLVGIINADKKETARLADETLTFLESICVRYDGYTAGNKAAAFKDVYDKVISLTEYATTEHMEDSNFLLTYSKRLGLSGVVVTDETGALIAQADENGHDVYTVWENVLTNENKMDIVESPQKVFATELDAYGEDYYVVFVSRQDKKGLVVCYKNTELVDTDLYSTSIDKTLTNNTFHKNPRIVITDTKTVIASNNDFLSLGMDISDEPFAEVGSKKWKEGKLIRLLWDNGLWYGKREVYGRYRIYVFYSAGEVLSNLIPLVIIFLAGCALIAMTLMLLKNTFEKKHLKREREQLQTIRAISSLYVSTSILHLKEKTFEGIVSTKRAQQVLDETVQDKEVAKLLAERIIAPKDGKRYMEFLDFDTMQARLEGKNNLSAIVQDRNGVWFSIFLVPVEYDKKGRLTDVLFASRNINEYKQQEEAYKEQLRKTARDAEIANAGKTSFLRRMSHDIRTPINGIRGMALLAKKSLDNPKKVDDCIDKILYSSDYLTELLDDILRMSKLESGKIFFDEKSFDLKELLIKMAQLAQEKADEKQIEFTIDFSGIVHTQVIASPIHLRQVVQNILSNAIKFNRPGGSVRVLCRESAYKTSDKMLFEFICSDTGIGMNEEFQKEIFEPFAQESDSARSSYAGAGLGLSIAKEILEQRGGKISFTSEKDVGSTFHVTVPLKIDQSMQIESLRVAKSKKKKEALKSDKTLSKVQGEVSLEGLHILVAEDNAINMEIVTELLEQKKAVMLPAENGKEAVKLFEASAPYDIDVILMDIMMPEMNGLDAAKAIRAMQRADALSVPIFAMTANAFVEDVQISKTAGMNEHFSKPLDMERVADVIDRYCRKRTRSQSENNRSI